MAFCKLFIDFDPRMGTRVGVFWCLLVPFFDIFPTMFRKGVFEGSLAGFGYPFGSILVAWVIFLAPFWHRKPSQQRERERIREREIYFATISVYTLVFAPWRLAGGRRPPRCGCTLTSCNHQNRCTSALEIDRAHVNSTHVTYL